jgi:hypothetical protein
VPQQTRQHHFFIPWGSVVHGCSIARPMLLVN